MSLLALFMKNNQEGLPEEHSLLFQNYKMYT